MKAEEIQVGKLFQPGQQLIIPRWQRHYAWGVPQWQELWDDLLRARDTPHVTHFLGSIVLKAMPYSGMPSDAHQFWVVDGQQRITTLTILMCVLRDRQVALAPSEDEGYSIHEQQTSQLLLNSHLKQDHRFRLVLQERDQNLLRPIVLGNRDGSISGAVDQAYVYLRDLVASMGRDDVDALVRFIMTRAMAVWVTLEDADNAHRVFQTLNAGGKKLQQSDLVRNYFFLLLGDLGDDFYAGRWRQLEADLGSSELEEFMVAWAVSQGHRGSKDALFDYFHKDLRDVEHSPTDVLAYGTRLVDASKLFRLIRHPEDFTGSIATRRALADLAIWGTVPADGLLLWLLRMHADGVVDDTELARCFEIVLSFMARRQLTGTPPNLHKSIFVSTTIKLRGHQLRGGTDIADYLHYTLSSGPEGRAWPTDDQVRSAARSTQVYSGARSRWAFLILRRINETFFENLKHTPPGIRRQEYSVEHVLPQKLTPQWEADLSEWGVENPRALHETHLHVLGNLTITPINSELSNAPFDQKRIKLKDDWLRINAEVAESSTWTQAGIDERSATLARKACRTFTPPLSGAALRDAELRFATVQQAAEPDLLSDDEDDDA